jgi:hypothetical protein
VAFVTDFQRLEIDFQNYQRLAEAEAFFASIEGHIKDAVTGQRGDWDWYGSVHGFFTEVESLWRKMKDRERERAIRLNHESPEKFLADTTPGHVREMGLIDLLTLLRQATCAQPEIEEYNWSCPGDQPKKPDPDRDRRFIAAFQSGLVMAVLHRLQELCQLSAADIEELLRLKPVFDSLTVDQFRSWTDGSLGRSSRESRFCTFRTRTTISWFSNGTSPSIAPPSTSIRTARCPVKSGVCRLLDS